DFGVCRFFRQQLDELGRKKQRHLSMTMAAAANPPTLKWLTNELLLETMDWVNAMTYDMAVDRTPQPPSSADRRARPSWRSNIFSIPAALPRSWRSACRSTAKASP